MGRKLHAVPIDIAEHETQKLDESRAIHPTANVYHLGEKTEDAIFDPAFQLDADGNPIPWEKIVADYVADQKAVGRPTAYNRLFHPRMAYLILAKTGAEIATLAELFGVNEGTFSNWRWKHAEFNAAIKAGWDEFAINVAEKALLNRAIGYRTEDVEYQRVPIYDTVLDNYSRPHRVVIGYEQVETKRTQRSIAADPTCLMFLLQNRHGDRWRNVRKVEATLKTQHAEQHLHQHVHLAQSSATQRPEELLQGLSDDQLRILHAAAEALRLTTQSSSAADIEQSEQQQIPGVLEVTGSVIDDEQSDTNS